MKDAEYDKQKKRISKLASKWIKPAGFGWWGIDLVYSRTTDDENPECAGKTSSRWEYSEATITFFLPVTCHMDDEDLEHMFVHELCHLPMSGMRIEDNDSSNKLFERAVDDYAKHLLFAYRNVK